MKHLLLIVLVLVSCGGGDCESELLVLHHTQELTIEPSSIEHWVSELERATGRRWKVEERIEAEEISDVYKAQELFGDAKGYHLFVAEPAFSAGMFWIVGAGFALGCTQRPYRVATCSYSVRNLPGSNTACLHELGHLCGAGHGAGVMSGTNQGAQFFTRDSVAQIRACKGEKQCRTE